MSIDYETKFEPLKTIKPIGFKVTPKKEMFFSVSGDSEPSQLTALISLMSKLHLTSDDILQRLIKDGIANATDAVSFKSRRSVSKKRTAFNVSMTTGYLKKLNNFLIEYCGGNRKFMVEEFVIWCQEQTTDKLYEYMDKYFYSPVRLHRKAKKGTFFTNVHSDAHDYLVALAEDFTRRYRTTKISAGDVFRGLFFRYVDSMQS